MAFAPSKEVVGSFGVDDEPVALPGGEGLTFRAGRIVLKRAHDVAETEWIQELLARLEPDGFRVAIPIPAADGRWVFGGWAASEFIPGLEPLAPRWNAIIEWGLRFGVAAERARPSETSPLDGRVHRWAIADRVAWGEADVALPAGAAGVRSALAELLVSDPANERHVVHGDLTGNVFMDPLGRPVILDVSPYLRERRWAAAIVVADAVLWCGADPSLAREFASSAHDRDLLGRALVFRLAAEQRAADPRHGSSLEPYRAVLAALA